MSEGEQIVATIANMSIEAAKLLAKALEKVFDEIAYRTRAEYQLTKYQALEAQREMQLQQRQWSFDDAINKGGWLKDYKEVRAMEDPNDPFVACGFYTSEENMNRINEYARREGIPFTGLQTEKDDNGKRTFILYCRESEMEKIADITALVNYDKRIEGFEKAIEDTENILLNQKKELAELTSNNGDGARIAELHRNIADNEEIIRTLTHEKELTVASREYFINKMRFGDIVEESKQKVVEDEKIADIDKEIQNCNQEIENLSVVNDNLQENINEINFHNPLTAEDERQLKELNAQVSNNKSKIDSLQKKIGDLQQTKDTILQERATRAERAKSKKVSLDKTHSYNLKGKAMSFSEAINRNTNKNITKNSSFAHYFLLDMSNPNQYIECKGANDMVDGKRYMKSTYDIYVDGKKVDSMNDGRISGETVKEHNYQWAKTRKFMQDSYGFSDNIIYCRNANELKRYQSQLLSATEKTQSKVNGFENEAKSVKKQDYSDTTVKKDDIPLGRNYKERIDELRNDLLSLNLTYHDGTIWDLKYQEALTLEEMIEIGNSDLERYNYVEGAVIARQIDNYVRLEEIDKELITAQTKLYALSAMPMQEQAIREQIAQLQAERSELIEKANVLQECRTNVAVTRSANEVCEYNYSEAVVQARQQEILEDVSLDNTNEYYQTTLDFASAEDKELFPELNGKVKNDAVLDDLSLDDTQDLKDSELDIDGNIIPTDENGFDLRSLDDMEFEAKKGSDLLKAANAANPVLNQGKVLPNMNISR